jgi:HSP20 family molecular chaperone IbpA
VVLKKKYHKINELPYDTDINTVRSDYKNGTLKVTIAKRTDKSAKCRDQGGINYNG